VADTSRPGIDDGHIRSIAGRVAAQLSSKDKITYYHDEQDKVRGHWGIASTIPPEASAIQATPTSFVSVSKYTRTQSNKLLFDAGFAVYDQEYLENYQPEVFANSVPLFNIIDSATNKNANAWNNPADHVSKLFTEQFAANYITGAHSLRGGIVISQAQWRLAQQYTLDVQPVTYNAGVPVSVALKIPTDRRNSIKEDMGLFIQDKWTISRATINAGVRYDKFVGATNPETLPAGTFNSAVTYSDCSDGKEQPECRLHGRVTNWQGHQPARRHRLRPVWQRQDGHQGERGPLRRRHRPRRRRHRRQQQTRDDGRPDRHPRLAGYRRQRLAVQLGRRDSAQRADQLHRDAELWQERGPRQRSPTPGVLEGWGARGYKLGVHRQRPASARAAGRHQWRLVPAQVRQPDGDRGHRYSFANNSFDGPFCVNAPIDANLPGGGGYQVCGLYDLKPAVVAQALPANSTIRFSSDYGGETNIYEGFEVCDDSALLARRVLQRRHQRAEAHLSTSATW